ncbi:hypothetical protein [Parapedobacter sp. 10938]|uniref:hypothetical protein n=1 Tax=Parapedobacter flavus TaxID=3110225 RepID=UPI002DBA13D8|nr:hypothetical protein [Parapedobacter sp. 10938]MEC3878502.1 hypothetical protein [Parapedobacter sp. 10938]
MLTSIVKAANYPSDFDTSVKAPRLSDVDFNSFLKFKTGGELIKLDGREAMLRVLKLPIPSPDTVFVNELKASNEWDSGFDPFRFPEVKSRYQLTGNHIFTDTPTRVSLSFLGGSCQKDFRDGHDYYTFKSTRSISLDLNDEHLFIFNRPQSANFDIFLSNMTDSLYIGIVYYPGRAKPASTDQRLL